MGIFNKLFGEKTEPAFAVLSREAKEALPVLPVLKRTGQYGMSGAHTTPFVLTNNKDTALHIAFTQDVDGVFYYLTDNDLQNPAIHSQFLKWKENIDVYVFEPYLPAKLNLLENMQGCIVFAAGYEHSAEKIFSASFLTTLCDSLKTDQLIISTPRRGLLMATSYQEEFMMLENFFYTHQDGWQNDTDGSEFITDMVFVANKTRILYAALPDFRINVYEKDGNYKISYSTTGELLEKDGNIHFQAMLERSKIDVIWPV